MFTKEQKEKIKNITKEKFMKYALEVAIEDGEELGPYKDHTGEEGGYNDEALELIPETDDVHEDMALYDEFHDIENEAIMELKKEK